MDPKGNRTQSWLDDNHIILFNHLETIIRRLALIIETSRALIEVEGLCSS